jgi:hypothetical protein
MALRLTIPLPDWLLEANRAGPADLTFVSLGGYGPPTPTFSSP